VEAIDFVFSGPALITFPQFVEYRLNGDLESCHQLPGVFSKVNCPPVGTSQRPQGKEASPLSTPTAPFGRSLPVHANPPHAGPGTIGPERDIDAVVELDYRSFLRSYSTHFPNKEIPPILLFETSRGCWWGERSHCTFCGLNGLTMNYHAMSPQK